MQQQLFLCHTCGSDTLLRPCSHVQEVPVRRYLCPVCHEPKLTTEDPNDPTVDWVALGEVVCGRICHEKAYDTMREGQLSLPFHPHES